MIVWRPAYGLVGYSYEGQGSSDEAGKLGNLLVGKP